MYTDMECSITGATSFAHSELRSNSCTTSTLILSHIIPAPPPHLATAIAPTSIFAPITYRKTEAITVTFYETIPVSMAKYVSAHTVNCSVSMSSLLVFLLCFCTLESVNIARLMQTAVHLLARRL